MLYQMCHVESFLRGSSLWIGAPFQFLLSLLLLFVCPIIADILFGGIFCEALFFEFLFQKPFLFSLSLSFGGGISALFCWQSELGISVLAAAVIGEWRMAAAAGRPTLLCPQSPVIREPSSNTRRRNVA